MHSSRMRTGRALTIPGVGASQKNFFGGKKIKIEKKRKKKLEDAPPRKIEDPHPPDQTLPSGPDTPPQ